MLCKNLAVTLENSSFLSWKVNSLLAVFKNVLYSDLSELLGVFYGFLGYSVCKNAMTILTDLFLMAFLPSGNCNLLKEFLSLSFATLGRYILLVGFT